ncbi:unnamed protein product [Staurois parvus]|uniref:Uncharacterized protein n=1 Tax=Staurois parvus TaxID=386267 RepID=A0ABN9DFS8_9NEOB|nr:unnamed protein product [Staurois parvus]
MTPKGRGMMVLVVLQQLEDCQFDTPDLGARVSNWRTSSCCQTTSPMRHCKIDS